MDGVLSKDRREGGQVVVIACTNRVDMVDPAILRPGRLDYRLNLDVPDKQQIMSMLRGYFRGIPHTIADNELVELVNGCRGFSGARIQTLIREAALQSIRFDAPSNSPVREEPISFTLLQKLLHTASE
jgi:ATP-dependent 26S proteasome regulatory subunit